MPGRWSGGDHRRHSVLLALIHESFEGYRGRLDPPRCARGDNGIAGCTLRSSGERVLAAMDGSAAGCALYVQTGVEMYLHRLAVLPALRRAGKAGAGRRTSPRRRPATAPYRVACAWRSPRTSPFERQVL